MAALVSTGKSYTDLMAADEGQSGSEGEGQAAGEGQAGLTAAQRARAERQRQRARALRAARPIAPDNTAERDGGGGFLLPAAAEAVRVRPQSPAPPPARASWPECRTCGERFPRSELLEAFGERVCDACHEPEAHALLPRTEAKRLYLLQDADLDARPPPLRALARPNPHRRGHAMRLYLLVQVERRALDVWGSEEALEAERARRAERSERARVSAGRRRLRALRLAARASTLLPARSAHAHRFGPEAHDAASDTYSRACELCDHVETYEKM